MIKTHCVDDILKCRGIRQGWLAKELGISDAYLSKLLSGDKRWTERLKDETARLIMVPRRVLFFEYDGEEKSPSACEKSTISQAVSEEAT